MTPFTIIVEPLGGEVVEAGLPTDDIAAGIAYRS